VFFLSTVASIGAMDKNSLAEQSDEMKVGVILAIPCVSGNLQQAALTIKALARCCKGFCEIINDDKITKNLVKMLVVKFGGYHENIAQTLGTKEGNKYITSHTDVLEKWRDLFKTEATMQEAQHLLDSMGDIGFVDRNGKSVLCHMVFPFADPTVYMNGKSESEINTYKKSFINVFTHVFNYGKQQGAVWDLKNFFKYVASFCWDELGILIAQLDEAALVNATLLTISEQPHIIVMDDDEIVRDPAIDLSRLVAKWIKQAKQDKQ